MALIGDSQWAPVATARTRGRQCKLQEPPWAERTINTVSFPVELSTRTRQAVVRDIGTGIWGLDLQLRTQCPEEPNPLELDLIDSAWARFLVSAVPSPLTERPEQNRFDEDKAGIRFLFPLDSGFVNRSDFLTQRLECCEFVLSAASFVEPLQAVSAVQWDTDNTDLPGLLSRSIGAIILHPTSVNQDIDVVLKDRLSFPWRLPRKLEPRRIAWVQGREDIDCIERALKSARTLGIALVILDEPGHWLEDPNSPWAQFREAFVPVDITPNDGLAQRITDACRSYPRQIDGVVTISDVRLPAIARACGMLGLPSENPEAYDIAGNKGLTRMLETVGRGESFVLDSFEGLRPFLDRRHKEAKPLRYPLVVKPVVGWCSDCVSKVHDEAELGAAVRKASDRHKDSPAPSTTVVVEPYVNGPEVDANMVLLDGKILFCDVNDDFPSPADQEGAGADANFQETQNVMPSALPAREIAAIRTQMRDSILRQGFRSGTFHCEARVRNSSVRYTGGKDGIVDLTPTRAVGPSEEPMVYLHEINARPPGYLESVAIALAYGVDYYACRMLLALGSSETDRLRALSQAFLSGPQFHLSLMIIQQTKAGIMKSADAAKEFLDEHPHLKPSVVDYYTRKKAGDVLEGPDASALWWIAYYSVVSRSSRSDLLKKVDFILENFSYEIA